MTLIKCKFALEKEQEEPEIGSGHRGDFPFFASGLSPGSFLAVLKTSALSGAVFNQKK